MSSQRSILAFVLLASVAVALISSVQASNLIVGHRRYHDHQAARYIFFMASHFGEVRTDYQTYNTMHGETITQVRLLDQNKRNGARVYITAGGPGYKFVTVYYRTKRGGSINFIAELYGR